MLNNLKRYLIRLYTAKILNPYKLLHHVDSKIPTLSDNI